MGLKFGRVDVMRVTSASFRHLLKPQTQLPQLLLRHRVEG